MENTCCFTGHRPQSLPWRFREEDPRCRALKDRLRKQIVRAVRERGVERFLSGMALGVDTWAAEAVLELGKRYPIALECVLPCAEQTARWGQAARQRYEDILARCDKVTLLQQRYTADCFEKRNRAMVERSGLVIAVWDGSPSGTGNTVAYAKRCGREVWVLEPVAPPAFPFWRRDKKQG